MTKPTSIHSREILAALRQACRPRRKEVWCGDRLVDIPAPFPSPGDWRDHWIYSLLVDRFHNPLAPPRAPWNRAQCQFQGGNFAGVRAQLPYLRELGVGALLLSPVLKNCPHDLTAYHGYGPQNFLEIEPRFASDPLGARRNPTLAARELRALIDDAHARGIFVIFDVVLNHAGDVFAYPGGSAPGWRSSPYPIHWRDAEGRPRPDWSNGFPADNADAAVQPIELRHPRCFVRRGQDHKTGDFYSNRKLATDSRAVRDTLLRVHQYLIAAFDVDGFRIDAVHLLDEEFAFLFPDEIRNYALSIGKTNFLLFGEATAGDPEIARYVGRNCPTGRELVGLDAMLDYPLFFMLPDVLKGFAPPLDLARFFERRQELHVNVLGSRDEPGTRFVTFLDNHDQHRRFYHRPPDDPHAFDDQVGAGFGCLFSLPGIPSVYYGTEQGLCGTEERYSGAREAEKPRWEWVRESLWGKPGAFDPRHPFYRLIQRLSAIRRTRPAQRYGRLYFRPTSCNGWEFGCSTAAPGPVAFSRIVADDEVVCVVNTSPLAPWAGEVIVDYAGTSVGSSLELLFSNQERPAPPGPIAERRFQTLVIHESGGQITRGPARTIAVRLRPMEVQLLGRRGLL